MTTFGDWVDWLLGRQIPHSQLVSEKKSLLISIEDKKNRIKALQVDVTNMSRDQEKFTDEINKLKNWVFEKNQEINKVHEERELLEQRHESTEKTLSDKVLKLNSVHTELVQVRLSQQSLYKKELEYETLDEEHKTLKKKCETMETRTRMLEKVICEKEITAGSYEEKNEELQISLKSLQIKNKQMETELASLQKIKKEYEMKQSLFEESNAQMTASLKEVEQSNTKLSISNTSKDRVGSAGQYFAGDMVENPSEVT